MSKRFNPVLAAAVAAGAIPLLENATPVKAVQVTAAGWTFESITLNGFTIGSFTVGAQTNSPGYGGTLTGTLANTAMGPGWHLHTGNGSLHGIGSYSGWDNGGNYTFKFDIDELDTLLVRFDMRSNPLGPGQFIVQYSDDNSTFSNAGTALITFSDFWTTATTGSHTAASYSFALAGFSDPSPGVAGDFAYVRLLQSGNAVSGGAIDGEFGDNYIDNVFIVGQSIPEPSSIVMTLAAAAGLVSRPRRRED